jgi:hypothetical protein
MTHARKHVNFETMTPEQVMTYFSKSDLNLETFLKNKDEQDEVDDVLNKYLGMMWEDNLHSIHLAKEIRAYLLARGRKINPTNTEKGWQRRKEVYGIESDPVEKVRAWLSSVPQKVSRLFRRR